MDIPPFPCRIAVVGQGRLGSALVSALSDAGADVDGPLGRGATGDQADLVILAVPDQEIANAARHIAPGRLVAHCSGATSLDALRPHERLSVHPLMTVTGPDTSFDQVPAAVAGSTPRALATATHLATTLGMHPTEIDEDDRAAYHAAASMASNFLVTLEAAAEQLAATAGAPRELLVPLVRATVENWATQGAEALTGPIARGDTETVARQRAAVQERTPELLPLFDAMAQATQDLASVPA
jgi:predicted short-subunit dehydrogenase-like oxidoreductase (DUF2520 family)